MLFISSSAIAGLVVTLLANAVSVAACVWLLSRFRKLGVVGQKRMFARQLRHLAIADILIAVGTLVYTITEFIGLQFVDPIAESVCVVELSTMAAAVHVSTFVETYIALGFLGIYWRRLVLVKILDASLPALWIVGFVLALYEIYQITEYDSSSYKCVLRYSYVIHLGPWLLLCCFTIVAIAYAATIYRVWKYPGVVQALVWRTAWVYPVNFFVTYGAAEIYFIAWPAFRGWHIFFTVAIGLIGLNGLVNVLSYAYNSRSVRLAMSGNTLSHNPDGGISEPFDAMGFVSFHVGFESASELFVTDIENEARLQSDRDLTILEAARSLDTSSDVSSSISSYDWYPPPDPLGEPSSTAIQ